MRKDLSNNSIEEIFEQAPLYHVSLEASNQMLQAFDNELEKVTYTQKKMKAIKLLCYSLSIAFIVIAIAGLIYNNLSDTSRTTSLPPNHDGILPIMQEDANTWEPSSMFDYEFYKLVGEEDQFGLVVGAMTTLSDGTVIPLFTMGNKNLHELLVIKPFEELEGKHLKVIATNQHSGASFELIEGSPLEQIRNVGRVRTTCGGLGCSFPNSGLWKLSLLIDNEKLGDIIIHVEAKTAREYEIDAQLEQIRQQIIDEMVDAFELDLEYYDYIDNYSFLENQSLSILMFQNLSIGDYRPLLFLYKDRDRGLILEKKRDGTNIMHEIVLEDEGWVISFTNSITGSTVAGQDEAIQSIPSYSPLTEEQVQDFINQKGIIPLDIKNVGDYTIFLYETELEIGSYVLASVNGRIYTESEGKSSRDIDNRTVSISGSFGEKPNGMIAYVQIIIHDESILENGDKIKVIFTDNSEVIEAITDRSGYIIPNFEFKPSGRNPLVENLIILDEHDNELFNLRNFYTN